MALATKQYIDLNFALREVCNAEAPLVLALVSELARGSTTASRNSLWNMLVRHGYSRQYAYEIVYSE